MKRIFKSTILLAVAGLSLFTSCKDDNESNPTLTQPTTFVLNEPVIKGTIDLEKTTAPIVLTWSQPTPYNNFNAPVVPTYWVEISPKGTFNQAFNADAEDNSSADYFVLNETYSSGKNVEVSPEFVNSTLLQMYGWTEENVPAAMPLSIRVKSAVRDASFREYGVIYSNIVTVMAAPYFKLLKPADPQIWWLIGADIADGSWGSDIGKCVIPMQTIEGETYDSKAGLGVIQWVGYLGGNGFKLRGALDDGWASQWGQGDAFGSFVKNEGGSGNITVPAAGIYTVTLDTKKDELTVEAYSGSAKVYDGMAISGSFNGWGDTEMTPCSTGWENHDWYIVHDFAAGDEVKVKQAGSWDFNKGGVFVDYSEGMYVYGISNGANLVIGEAGSYMILFNDITGYIRFIKQ
jgi:hypothetical protein